MSPALIHKSFLHLLRTGPEGREQRRLIGMTPGMNAWYRWRMLHHNDIKLETMLRWLKLAGMDTGAAIAYSKADMIAFGKWANHPNNNQAKKLGWEYLLEKWEASR